MPWSFTLPQPGVDPNYSDDMNWVIGPNFVADANYIKPIENGSICGTLQSYDVAFELETDPAWVKWQQAFTGLRDWPHYEDEESYSGLAWASSIAYKWIQEPRWQCHQPLGRCHAGRTQRHRLESAGPGRRL